LTKDKVRKLSTHKSYSCYCRGLYSQR